MPSLILWVIGETPSVSIIVTVPFASPLQGGFTKLVVKEGPSVELTYSVNSCEQPQLS